MRVVILAMYDANIFPGLYHLGVALAKAGAEVHFMAQVEPKTTGVASHGVIWEPIPPATGWRRKLPWFRSGYQDIFSLLDRTRPHWIIAQHQFVNPALIHKLSKPWRREKVAGYFSDYHEGWRYVRLAQRLSWALDAYVDICDLRRAWRARDWPRMRARPFVIRQAPYRDAGQAGKAGSGNAKIVLTASRHMLGMDRGRLSRFIDRICGHGLSIDWYLAAPARDRAMAQALSDNPRYLVREPVPKSSLLDILREYDAGLFWGPMVERNPANPLDKSYFLSAASNKIGEYIAAGLVVAHTGNLGLSYLPDEVCAVFDPTDPEAGADQLAAALADRQIVERKRQAALNYHREEMNFEAQAAPFIHYILHSDREPAAL